MDPKRFQRRHRLFSFVAGASVVLGLLVSGALVPDAQGQKSNSLCYKISGSAPYRGLGYHHIVTVKNGCPAALDCEVWTDVDPKPKHDMTIDRGKSASVTIRIGAPTATFAAKGTCTGAKSKPAED